MTPFIRIALLMTCLPCSNALLAIEQHSQVDAETKLTTQILSDRGFEIKFTQQSPDLVRAFFLGRGFPREIADSIGLNCSFQVIAKNESSASNGSNIDIELSHWVIHTQPSTHNIKLKEHWMEEWNDKGISPASKVAFRWATFPTQQMFNAVGDFGWGMVTMGLAPGSLFDLIVVWERDGERQQHRINGMQCPEDN